MKKQNLERKIDMALTEALKGLRSIDENYYSVSVDVMRYHLERCVSILCMTDDWEVSDKCTYYCLSEIERNVNGYLEERKLKGEWLTDENVNRRIHCVGDDGKGFRVQGRSDKTLL